jgi:hypothetical protein
MVQNAGSAERAAIFAAAAVSSMNVFYEREARIRINLLKQKLYASCDNDPIHQKMVSKVDTNAPQTLTSFRTLAPTLPETSDPNIDIAFLRYKAIPGYSDGLVGYAYLSGACGNLKYGLSLQFEDTLLFSLERSVIAHEIGHLLGARHYNCGLLPSNPNAYFLCPYLMYPSLNYAVKLGEYTVNEFNTFLDTKSCWSNPTPRTGSAPYFDSADGGRDNIYLRVPEGIEAVFDLPIKDPDNDLVSIRSAWELPPGVRLEGGKLKVFKPLDCSKPPPKDESIILTAVDAAGHETSGEIQLYYWRSPLHGTGTVDPMDPYGSIDARDSVLYPGDHYKKSFGLGIPGISYVLKNDNRLKGVGELRPITFDSTRAGVDWQVTPKDVGRRFDVVITAERCGETFEVKKRFAVLSKPGVPAIYKDPWAYMLQEGIPGQYRIKVISGIDFSSQSYTLELLEPKPNAVQSLKDGILYADSGEEGVKGCVKDNPYDILEVPLKLIDPTSGSSSLTTFEFLHLNLRASNSSTLVDEESERLWRSTEPYVKLNEERTIPIRFQSDEPDLPYTLEGSDYYKEYAQFDPKISSLKMKGVWPSNRPLEINSSAYRPASLFLNVCPQDGREPIEHIFNVEVSNWRSAGSTQTPLPNPTTPTGLGTSQTPTLGPTPTTPSVTPTPTEQPTPPPAEISNLAGEAGVLRAQVGKLKSTKASGLQAKQRAARVRTARQLRTAIFDFIARFEALLLSSNPKDTIAAFETLEFGALKLDRQSERHLAGTKRTLIAALTKLHALLAR